MTKPLYLIPLMAIAEGTIRLLAGLIAYIQAEGFSTWLYRQTVPVVLLIIAIALLTKYFNKRDEKKDAQLAEERKEARENLKEQVRKADVRMEKFDLSLNQQTEVGRQSVEAIKLVNTNLARLADDLEREQRKHL